LDEAETNGEDDTIQIVRGTYTGNFVYDSGEGYGIVIKGGFAAGCSKQEIGPVLTILDGNGAGSVLFIEDSKGGDIRVENVTVRGGRVESGEAGAGNQITGIWQLGAGAFAHLYSKNSPVGEISLLNNTITENRGDENGAGVYLACVSSDNSGMVSAYNNIIQGNEGGYGADIYISAPASYGYHNNFHEKAGSSWTGTGENIDVFPDFVSPGIWDDSDTPGNLQDDVWTAGNYRLKAGSPCIDAGILSRKVYMCNSGCMWLYFSYAPETDFEGDERTDKWHALACLRAG
jgi:hypothetical protein